MDEILIPIILAAAQRSPTAAALRSVRAALTGATRAAYDQADVPALVRDRAGDGALAATDAVAAPDWHGAGLPDPAFDWMFAPRA